MLTTLTPPALKLHEIPVGLGEVAISRNENEVLVAFGLGSCVGIGLYDPVAHVGGLLHAVLPAQPTTNTQQPLKYVDSGLVLLLEQLRGQGAFPRRMLVRLVGGANVLGNLIQSPQLNIGSRNLTAALEHLSAHQLPITAQDTGGTTGRTMRMYIADGRVTVRGMGKPERDL